MFDKAFIGLNDSKGNPIHNGDHVILYYKGELVNCTIVYVPDSAMFCVQWPDGYINKWPINASKLTVVK
jgi:hypothetical protein